MFELKNKTVIITNPTATNDKLSDALTAFGAEVIQMPAISISKAKLSKKELSQLQNTADFDVIIFTSRNGIKNFFAHKGATISDQTKTAVIGNSTAAELLHYGQMPSFTNTSTTAAEFVIELKDIIKPGDKVLLILGNIAPEILNNSISEYANVTRINVYNTTEVQTIEEEALELIEEDDYDMMLFSSPSAVRSVKRHLSDNVFIKLKAAGIGPVTGSEMTKFGLTPLFVSEVSTAKGFAEATEKHFA